MAYIIYIDTKYIDKIIIWKNINSIINIKLVKTKILQINYELLISTYILLLFTKFIY